MLGRVKSLVLFAMLMALFVSGSASVASAHTSTASMPAGPAKSQIMAQTICTFVSSTTRPTLQRGSTGNAVKQVQCLINNFSIYPLFLSVDGVFGSATDSAVRFVQQCAREHGLPNTSVDGIVGPQTWNILYNEPAACRL